MEEYIRLEEEKAQKREKVFNWETSKYGKIWYDEDIHDLRSVETEFPAISFNDEVSSKILSCKPTVSSLNDEIDFKISFDSTSDYTNDLDFFKDFENEFPAIVYNDALTSKSDFSTECTLCPQHIDEFDLKDETSLSEYDENEQNVLYFNDLFPFNIIYPDDLKSNKIDMIQSSGGNENTHWSNNQLEGSHDKISKVFIMRSFVMELNVNIVAWNYLVNGMLFNLIKNLYVLFGIPFNPKRYYKDGDCARMLRRPRYVFFTLLNLGKIGLQERIQRIRLKPIRHMALPSRDQRHQYLRFEGLQYIDVDIADFETRFARIYIREVHRVQVFDFGGLPNLMAEGLSSRMLMEHKDAQGQMLDLDTTGAYSFSWVEHPMLRLCHRLIAYSIAGRSQAPEKVTVTDLFYLRGIDVGSLNVPYLLARYLRLFASRRKHGAMISRGVDEETLVAPGGGDEDEEMP
ncbi:hypothetical protein Tco_0756738 [Tanacetum coccineum]